MEEIDNKKEFIVCPQCNGRGIESIGTACSNCNGIGTGVFENNILFYFKPKIGFATIELDHLRKKIHQIINIVPFTIGIIGFLALLYWFYQTASYSSSNINSFIFWQKEDMLLSIFWLSAMADLFIIYRIARDAAAISSIKIFKYDDIDTKNEYALKSWEEIKVSNDKVIDISKAMDNQAFNMLEEAFLLARSMRHKHVDPMHLFFVLMATKEAAAIFSRLGADYGKLKQKIKKHLSQKEYSDSVTELSLETKQALITAYIDASSRKQKKLNIKNLIFSSIIFEDILTEILYDMEIDQNKINNVIQWFVVNEKQVAAYRKFRSLARFKPSTNMDRAYTAVATPILNNFGYDMTLAAKWNKLEFCVAREKEIESIWNHFESGANGILLLGPDGAGKKTLMSGIAQKMVEEDVPRFLLDKRLIELDVARLVSGVSVSEAEGRMLSIIDEVARAGNIVLFIDNIENIIGLTSGQEGSMDLSEVLNGAIERRMLFAFASVTTENYMKYMEGGSLDSSFAKVEILEPRDNQAVQIIESKVSAIEHQHGVYFLYNAIEQSVTLSSKYMHDSYLPQKAITILEMAAVRVSKIKKDFPIIDSEDVAKIVSEMTDIPLTKITDNEGRELLRLEERMHERMVSQEEAVNMVAASLRRARTELREGVRPIASFLFMGPTGVGKTELAKTIADIYFGNEKYLIRIDMSEYQHEDSIKKMIGDVDGTKGYLTEQIRKTPFSLLLLDEIEKAHPDILNLFLQVMDDGRLTDGEGRLIDFTNVIIIATSNVGAAFIQDEIYKGTPIETISAELINNHLNKIMRPELINRFDGVIVFEPLSLSNVVDITRLMLKRVEKLLSGKGMELRVIDNGLRVLAKLGFDPKFGARPLRRIIQDRIENQIADKILSGDLKRRDTVIIDEDANVVIEKSVKL